MNSYGKKKTRWSSAALAAGTVSPPRGRRYILSAIEVVFASRSMAHLTGRSRVFVSFLMCRVYHKRKITVGFLEAFRSTGARQDAETLHGIDPGLIIVRVAQLRRPLGAFHQQLSSTPRHCAGKEKTQRGFPLSTRSLFHMRIYWLPVDLLTVLPCCAQDAPLSVFFYT